MSAGRQRIILILMFLITLNLPSAFAQSTGRGVSPLYVPRDSSAVMWSAGVGAGIPYGTFGGKFSMGTGLIAGDIGFGVFPFAWTPTISASGVLHFLDRYATVRPKATLTYSNVVAAILFLEENSLDPLYDETFPGLAAYAGVDWRISKTSPICIDLNVGWTFPFEGNDEIKKKFDEVKYDLQSQGYVMTDEKINLETPKISIGITYSIGRSLKMHYNR